MFWCSTVSSIKAPTYHPPTVPPTLRHARPFQVSNFLDFFKLEAGKRLDTVRSEVLLSDLVGDVYCIIEAMCCRGDAVALLPPDTDRAPAAPVLCDADRVRGVLLNLATNAAKFTRNGHICLRVQEVAADGFPTPPPGYAGITIRPHTPYASSSAAVNGTGDGSTGSVSDAGSYDEFTAAAAATAAAMGAVNGTGNGGAGEGEEDPLEVGAARWLRERQRQGQMVRECSFDADMVAALAKEAAAVASQQAPAPSNTPASSGSTAAAAALGLPPPAAAIVADGRAKRGAIRTGKSAGGSSSGYAAVSSRRRFSGGETVGAALRWLLFEVEDTGCGVAPEGLHGLFKEFVQGTEDEMSRPRSKGGTGLGLSICSKQVAVLGGAIGAYSRVGSGSTFWFTIPARVLQGVGATTVPLGPPIGLRSAAAATVEVAMEQQQRLQRQAQLLKEQQLLAPAGSSLLDSQDGQQRLGGPTNGAHPSPAAAAAAAAGAPEHTFGSQPFDSLARTNSSNSTSTSGTAHQPGATTLAPSLSGLSSSSADRRCFGRAPLDTHRLVGLSVLLAEDNAINQLVAKKMLTGLGMQVTVAGNGEEAVQAVEQTAGGPAGGFSVVLMDVLMPVMDGLEATAAIRAKGHGVPIVAMTANAGDKDRDECLDAGMNGFLPKPVLRDQLAGAILAVLPPLPGIAEPAAAAAAPE